jgi:hypothetical protein
MQNLLCEVGPETPEHESETSTVSEQLLQFVWRNPNDFLLQLVTVDETWLYHYNPETNQQSMEWQHSSSPCPTSKKL